MCLNTIRPLLLILIYSSFNLARVSKYPSPSANNFTNTTVSTTSPAPCSGKCPNLDFDMRKLSIELIRYDILRKLQLDEHNLPNVTIKDFPIPPTYLNEFINVQNDTPMIDDEEREEKLIAFSRMQLVMNGKETLAAHYFTFSDKLLRMRIDSATLHVHVRNSHNRKWPEYRIKILELISYTKGESLVTISHGSLKPYTTTAVVEPIRHVKSKWIQLDIKPILQKWLEKVTTDRKIGFIIEAVDLRDNPSPDVSVVMSTAEVDVNNNPFIEIKLSTPVHSRQPRNIGMDCDENSKETRCCRFPLVVDFEEFGWDWIIAPKKYDANYCSGECPFAFLQKYPHNHIVQQAGIGGPCCAARKMSPITMLYFDKESNIVFSVLNGMVVDKCGCS